MHSDSIYRQSGGPAVDHRQDAVRPLTQSPDQQLAFLREPLAFAVWLLIFLFAAVGRPDVGFGGWGWIGVAAAIALSRVLLAMRGLDAPGERSFSVGVFYLATHVAQAALWVLLLPGAGGAPALFPLRTAASFAGGALLSALSLRGWRNGWLIALWGWCAVGAMSTIVLWSAMPTGAVVLLLWLAVAAWLGLTPKTTELPAAIARLTGPSTQSLRAGSTRRGVQLAIHTVGAPMFGVYDGRIFEMNQAAETYLGRLASKCLGRPVSELLHLDPPSALDATDSSEERFALVSAEPPQADGAPIEPAMARIRVGRSNDHAPVAVVTLNTSPAQLDDPQLETQAQRMAGWLGADPSEVWFRDDAGRLFLPAAFDPGHALAADPDPMAFPLSALLPPDLRAQIDSLYREQLAAGQTFDERLTLIDALGVARPVRVVCLRRADDERSAAAVGVICPSDARARVSISRSDLLSELPVLIWLIDADARVVHAHASNVQRWGLRIEPHLRPSWSGALALQTGSHEAFARAVEQALDGKPTFDLLNYRTGPSGGRLALRSHFVPFQMPPGEAKSRRAVMVTDTIASARELLEIERLRLSKAQYKDLVEASPNLIWACDEAFRLTFLSRRACRDVYGQAVEDVLGAPIGALLDPGSDQTTARQALVGLRNGRPLRDVEMAHITKDRRPITVAMSAVALRSPDGNFAGAIGICVDMTTLKQREARLAEALRVERSVLDSAGQAIAVVKGGVVARCNDAFLQLLQMPPANLAAVPVADLFAERTHWAEVATAAERASTSDGAVTREMRVRRNGPAEAPEQFVWCQITLRSIGDGEYVVALADIDLIRRREAHAQHDARHDELTGLPNRRLLSERVRAALATSALRNSGCAILVFDLDGFKPINDRFGHATGDVVLREIARRLHGIVRPQDTVARIGGDEFALLMPDCGEVQDVERIARRILREVAQPLTAVDVGGARLTASLGVVIAPEHGRDPEWLMRLADRAMYDAKLDGGDRVMFAGSAASRDVYADPSARRAS